VSDRLRPLWDFDDLDGTEARLREQVEQEEEPSGRAEVLTQLARVEGLRGEFDAGEALLQEAESLSGPSAVAGARIDLERGRLRRSSGDREGALPLFERAFETALDAGERFIAVDAAHMAALAANDDRGFRSWTNRGIGLAQDADPSVGYWLGPLLNNLGWHLYDQGAYEEALLAFEQAFAARERDPENREAIEIALYCVAKTLRALSRAGEGVALLERATASAATDGRSDPWLHEELAETYAALGRKADAREHAEAALALLPEADADFDADGERASRLRLMAAEVAEAP
jgi:tetratricopeptide (TPR) repeat protein